MELTKDLLDGVSRLSVLVVGTVKNCEKTLDKSIFALRDALSDFHNLSFYIVESDSEDETIEKLQTLSASVSNFTYLSLGKLSEEIPSRTERIAFCRNEYINFISTCDQSFDYILVADLDGVCSLITRESILSCWLRNDWDACFANQLAPYYDIWALRHPAWCPTDCWKEYNELILLGANRYWARKSTIYSKMIQIDSKADWIEVDSAFGGLGIYRANVLAGRNYCGKNLLGEMVSEHVQMHNSMKLRGARLFINPSLINGAWNEHNREMRKLNQVVRYCKYLRGLKS